VLERNAFTLEYFNRNGWKCRKCISDPSLVIISRLKSGNKEYSCTIDKLRSPVSSVNTYTKEYAKETPGPGAGARTKPGEPPRPVIGTNVPKGVSAVKKTGLQGGPTSFADCFTSQIAPMLAKEATFQPDIQMPDLEINFDEFDVAYLLFHVDDGDMIPTSKELALHIEQVYNERYKVK